MKLQLARPGWRAGAAALATVIFAAFAMRAAFAFTFQKLTPEVVLGIDPDNPIAAVNSANSRIAAGDGRLTPPQLSKIARDSIRELPLNAEAFRLLAATAKGPTLIDQLGERMAVAHRLTRRDIGTELFQIEDAVRRNDIAGALQAYDSALRINESSRTLLYPVLTRALAEPLIRQRFRPYLKSSPPWLESFLRFAITTSTDPSAMVKLANLAGGFPKGEQYASLDTELLTTLVGRGQLDTAMQYYRSLPDANLTLIQNLAMTDAGIDQRFAPITWQAYSIPGIRAVWIAAGDTLELEAILEAGFAGPVARKLLALPAGSYQLSAPFRAEKYDPVDTIAWTVSCGGGENILAASSKLAPQGRILGAFTIPAGCSAQSVTVTAATAPSSADVVLTLTSPTLTRQR